MERRQARRDLNPHHPDLESGALPFELLACRFLLDTIRVLCREMALPRFPVVRVLTAKTTILPEVVSVRSATLIFCRRVITPPALIAR